MLPVYLVRVGEGDAAVREATLSILEMLGGMAKFVSPGMRVLIKPNFVAPVATAVTDYTIIRTLVDSVREVGATPFLGECPGFEFDSEATFKFLGVREFAEDCGVDVINFEYDQYAEVPFNHPRVPRVRVAKPALEADAIINVPRMKSHKLTTLSLGIKNCFGMIQRASRREVHAKGIDEGIAALYTLFKPVLTLVDGLTIPAEGAVYGRHHRFGVLAASEDMLSADIVCSRLLGADPADITHIAKAWKDKSLQPDVIGDYVDPIQVTGLEDTRKRRTYRSMYRTVYAIDHYLSKTGSKTVIPWFHRKLGIHPSVDWKQCNSCGECLKVCPVEAIDIKKRALDDSRCGRIRCMKCVEVCEPGAITIKQAFRSG